MFASGLINLSVYECADLAPFSKSTLTADDPLDDVLVFLEDGVDITCDEVRAGLFSTAQRIGRGAPISCLYYSSCL